MVHDLHAMLDAVGYVTRYGIEWRVLPADFPPRRAAHGRLDRLAERAGRRHRGRALARL